MIIGMKEGGEVLGGKVLTAALDAEFSESSVHRF
jgi:hypothetical protein